MKYFAYGSNMSTPRLRYRVPSCRPVSAAKLSGHQLRFHKRSKDGSAKCDVWYTGDRTDFVWGVLFEIPAAEKPALDTAEGKGAGYEDRKVQLTLPSGEQVEAITYIAQAEAVDTGLPVYTWYKDFVTAGATEHQLDKAYVAEAITPVRTMPDPDPAREKRERAKVR